jgi:hypothetical protein
MGGELSGRRDLGEFECRKNDIRVHNTVIQSQNGGVNLPHQNALVFRVRLDSLSTTPSTIFFLPDCRGR